MLTLTPSGSNIQLTFKRLQFPIRVYYYYKAQGQTGSVTGLQLEEPCFSHGLLYVGSSRVESKTNLLLYAPQETNWQRQRILSSITVKRQLILRVEYIHQEHWKTTIWSDFIKLVVHCHYSWFTGYRADHKLFNKSRHIDPELMKNLISMNTQKAEQLRFCGNELWIENKDNLAGFVAYFMVII